jgi:hypothetical protein
MMNLHEMPATFAYRFLLNLLAGARMMIPHTVHAKGAEFEILDSCAERTLSAEVLHRIHLLVHILQSIDTNSKDVLDVRTRVRILVPRVLLTYSLDKPKCLQIITIQRDELILMTRIEDLHA